MTDYKIPQYIAKIIFGSSAREPLNKTSEGRRAPVVTNDEATTEHVLDLPPSAAASPEPLTPSSQPGASEEAGAYVHGGSSPEREGENPEPPSTSALADRATTSAPERVCEECDSLRARLIEMRDHHQLVADEDEVRMSDATGNERAFVAARRNRDLLFAGKLRTLIEDTWPTEES